MQELPIDVNYQRLVEWLVMRKKLPADWFRRLQAIQAKVMEAVKELPPGLLNDLFGSNEVSIDYLSAREVRDKLAETGSRTLFGGLSGAAGVWDKIVKAYEKDLVFVGEAAQFLVQCTDYDIPYFKKQIAKHNQFLGDADKKQVEYTKSAAASAASYRQVCAELGIEGKDIRSELTGSARQLPSLYMKAVEALLDPLVAEAEQYYTAFTQYAHGTHADHSSLPALKMAWGQGTWHVPEEGGNKQQDSRREMEDEPGDVHVLRGSGQPDLLGDPREQGVSSTSLGTSSGEPNLGGIQWDIGNDSGLSATTGIDWEVPLEVQSQIAETAEQHVADGIQWDIDISGSAGVGSTIDWGHGDSSSTPVTIDWDVETTGEGGRTEAAADVKSEETVEEAELPCAPGVVGLLVQDAEFRGCLLDDLAELRAFLRQRRQELTSSYSGGLVNAMLPESCQHVDSSLAGRMLEKVEKGMEAVNSEAIRHLLMVATSRRYLDRQVATLERRAVQEQKMLGAAQDLEARKIESRRELSTVNAKVGELVSRMKRSKAEIEAALSTQFPGKRVNILGEVNSVILRS